MDMPITMLGRIKVVALYRIMKSATWPSLQKCGTMLSRYDRPSPPLPDAVAHPSKPLKSAHPRTLVRQEALLLTLPSAY